MPTYRLVTPGGTHSFELPSGRSVVVGRGVTCDVAIYDPTISRRHAELTATGDSVLVRDLGSSNGTCINGGRITSGRLTPGDTITFGKVSYQLQPWPPAGAAAAPAAGMMAPAGGMIVKQLAVSGGIGPGIRSGERLAGHTPGHLRVGGVSEEERLAKKLELLLDISQKLSGEFDLDKLLGTIVDTTFEVMSVDRVSILLTSDESGDLVPRISRSRLGDSQFQHVPRSIAQKVMEERVAVVSHNTAMDTRFKGQSILMQSVRSAMCSPLMASGDEVLGLLYVDSLTAANSFSDEDLQFLVAFSGLAAAAIRNTRYAERIRREAMVRSNFERFFAPNVAAQIARHEAAIRPGGDKRPIAVLFADIRGFTSIAERADAGAIAELLTDYFTEMVDVIFEHGGTLDKFIGDALMALWGAPIAHADDAARAVEAAIAMQRALVPLNARWRRMGRPEIGVGIGINYGEAFAGHLGSHRRLEYTVIGDAVNVAARLCQDAGPGEILVTEAIARAAVATARYEPVPAKAFKGKTEVVSVFRVVPEPEQITVPVMAAPPRSGIERRSHGGR